MLISAPAQRHGHASAAAIVALGCVGQGDAVCAGRPPIKEAIPGPLGASCSAPGAVLLHMLPGRGFAQLLDQPVKRLHHDHAPSPDANGLKIRQNLRVKC